MYTKKTLFPIQLVWCVCKTNVIYFQYSPGILAHLTEGQMSCSHGKASCTMYHQPVTEMLQLVQVDQLDSQIKKPIKI